MNKTCVQCRKSFPKISKLSWKQWEERKLCSRQCAAVFYSGNYVHSVQTREKLRISHLGKPQLWNRGEKSHFWRGGKTKLILLLRNSLSYKNWRREVFERDNYTCQWCNQKGGVLNADHIKSFARFPESRFDISNGRTLCIPCHKKTDTFAGKSRI